MSERMLSGCCQQAQRRPARTVRFWLLAMHLAGLLERTRRRGIWHYSPTNRLRDLLDAGGMFSAPIRPDWVPSDDFWAADGPGTLEPGYVDPNTVGCEKIYSDERRNPSIGENHMCAKLTDDMVRTARTRWKQGKGESIYSLAKKCGVKRQTMWEALHRKNWRHVE